LVSGDIIPRIAPGGKFVFMAGKSAHPKKKWRRRASAIAASNHGLAVGNRRHVVHSTVTLLMC
jgi:hypothetical protein